jgi:hypothetical protein
MFGNLALYQGYETAGFRQTLGIQKSKDKLAETFSAHCVDSWVLAREILGRTQLAPDNTRLQWH